MKKFTALSLSILMTVFISTMVTSCNLDPVSETASSEISTNTQMSITNIQVNETNSALTNTNVITIETNVINSNSNTNTNSIIVIPLPAPAYTVITNSSSAYPEAADNLNSGLYWYKKPEYNKANKVIFDSRKPVMIYIHGAASSSGTVSDIRFNSNNRNDFNNQGSFDAYFNGWNVGLYNWKDNNWPEPAYITKSEDLADRIKAIIDREKMNFTEIRLVSYSWGIHVTAPAARKILQHIISKGLKIAVTIDFVDPVTDYAFRTSDIKNDLVWVCGNQVGGLKTGKKLIGLTVRRIFGNMDLVNFGYLFATEVLPHINSHVEANVGGADHWKVLENYKNQSSLTAIRADSNSLSKGYSAGTVTCKLDWIEAINWNWERGPVIEVFWQYVQHHYQYWYWENPGYWKSVYWYSYTEWYLDGWTWKSRTKDVYRQEWVAPSNWTWRWEPYAWQDWTCCNRIWNFMK